MPDGRPRRLFVSSRHMLRKQALLHPINRRRQQLRLLLLLLLPISWHTLPLRLAMCHTCLRPSTPRTWTL